MSKSDFFKAKPASEPNPKPATAGKRSGVESKNRPYSDSGVSVKPVFDTKSEQFHFKVRGRPKTDLANGHQGDHVTAYALVKRGIERLLRNLSIRFIRRKTDLAHIRQVRDQQMVDGYIAKVLATDEDVYARYQVGLKEIEAKYSVLKFSKGTLDKVESMVNTLIDTSTTLGEEAQVQHHTLFDEHIKEVYRSYAQTMCNSMCDLATSFLAHCNRMEGMTYEKIESLPAPKEESKQVKDALAFLDQQDAKSKELIQPLTAAKALLADLEQDMPATHSAAADTQLQTIREKHAALIKAYGFKRLKPSRLSRNYENNIAAMKKEVQQELIHLKEKELKTHRTYQKAARHIKALFFYPYVPEEYVKLHQEETGFRDNDPNKFYRAMARHLYIAFLAFDEFESQKEAIINHVVKSSVTGGWENIIVVKDAQKEVKEKLEELDSTAVSLTQTTAFNLSSSDDSSQSGHSTDSSGEEEQAITEQGQDTTVDELTEMTKNTTLGP